MNDERANLFEEAMKDPDFQEKFANVESEEALKELFETKGIIMTDEEINDFCNQVNAMLADDGEELSEDSLDNVAGGSWRWIVPVIAGWLSSTHGPIRGWAWRRRR